MPRWAFYSVPRERSPAFVDFASVPLVDLLAKAVRRAASSTGATFTVTEMLPDLNHAWLADKDGERYTAELRMVALDACRAVSRPPPGVAWPGATDPWRHDVPNVRTRTQ